MPTVPETDSHDDPSGRDPLGMADVSPEHRFSMSEQSSQSLHELIHAVPLSGSDEKLTQIQIEGVDGQHAALMRLNHPVRIHIEGPLGDYAFAFNAEADVRLTGSVAHGVAEGMRSGAV
ncbi:MAG: hypothetical protein MI861_06315, partial [Pirellulales bacterium]|nr:hypothetical protein [Pirellulales bacterium]